MKKNLFLLVALLFIGGITAQAQFKYGLKAGLNISKPSFSGDGFDDSNIESLTGFQVGPTIEFTVPIIGIGFDASVLYSQQGFKVKGGDTFKTNTLEVPVNLKYKISALGVVGAYLAVGPYASFNLSDDLGNQFDDKSFGAGLNFGLGVEILSHLQVGANYKLGLTNDFGASDAASVVSDFKGQQRGWTISATYFF
jgi:hypothetical protein